MSVWMERIRFGELWSELGNADLILVTANGVVDGRGRLIMGAGAAKQARDRFPGLDKWAGQGLRPLREFDKVIYGLMLSPFYSGKTQIGLFQVKYHWKQPASLSLMRVSALRLKRWDRSYGRIVMNAPGVGLGGLAIHRVLPMLTILPRNVILYFHPSQEAECRTLLNGS